MADINSSKWMEEDILNVAPPPDGIPAGTPPTALYDILRADKGAIKRKDSRENPRKISNGTGAAYVITYDVGPSEFIRGDRYAFVAHVANTGAASLKVNALAARSIVNNDGTPLSANQIAKDQIVEVAFDGTSFRLLSSNTANPKFTGMTTLENLTVTGTTSAQAINVTTVSATGNMSIKSEANRILWFRDGEGKETGLIYNNSGNNNTHLRAYTPGETTYKEAILQPDGQFILAASPTSASAATTKSYVDNAINSERDEHPTFSFVNDAAR